MKVCRKISLMLMISLFIMITFVGCGPKEKLVIVSGSENETLEPLLENLRKI